MKKRTILLTMVIILTTSVLIGCKKETNVTVKEDVKEESSIKDKEKELYKILGEVLIDNKEGYLPIGFKDDGNLILLDFTENNKYKHEIYNYNLKTNENVKVAELDKISTFLNPILNNKIIHIKDKKVYIYDVLENKSRDVYELDEVEKDLNKEKYKFSSEEELSNHISIEWVRGSDKYITIAEYIQYDGYHDCITRLVDITTGKEYNTGYHKDKNTGTSWVYSKSADMFYYLGDSKSIYEINPIKDKEAKVFIKLDGYYKNHLVISEEGKKLYISENDKDSDYIEELDIKSNKINKIFENKKYKDDGTGLNIRDFNLNGNIVTYSLGQAIEEKDWIKSYDESFVGEISNKEIINIDKLNYVNKYNIPNSNYIQFNNDGSKLIKRVLLQKNKDFKDVEYKYFLYERKK